MLLLWTPVLLQISSLFVCVLGHDSEETYHVEALPDSFAHLGEGPHWDVATQNLYSVNIEAGKLRRFDYDTNQMFECKIENEKYASFIIPMEGIPDQFAVGTGHRVSIVTWDGISDICKVNQTIVTVEKSHEKYKKNRFNDAKCDPLGRLYAGTMRTSDQELRTGSLYKITDFDTYKRLVTHMGISNGLTFDEKAKKFYLVDSLDRTVRAFDYDIKTGKIENPNVIYTVDPSETNNAVPDGMTIDSEGFLYVAINGGSHVFKLDPRNGEVVKKIKLPAEQVTSAAFGGPNLDILYVTTSDESAPSRKSQTFKVTGLRSKGLPMKNVNLNDLNCMDC